MQNGKGMSIAALICGILGIIGGILPVPFIGVITLILSILGIVFGVKGQKIAKETGEGKGLATAGLVLGIVGVAFGAVGALCAICAVCAAASAGAFA